MEISESIRNLIEIGFGLAYLFGGIANFLYLRRHGFGRIADRAWLPPSRRFIQSVVIPHSTFFTVLLFIFQELVAIAILSRGPFVVYGLVAGAIFSLWAVLVGNPVESITYFLLAAAQFFLAYTR
jgi:hypothetical protein